MFRALPVRSAGTNSYSGFGLFSKLGYMLINKFFWVSEILTGYSAKHNLKKDYLEKRLSGNVGDKDLHVVIKMFSRGPVYSLAPGETCLDTFPTSVSVSQRRGACLVQTLDNCAPSLKGKTRK